MALFIFATILLAGCGGSGAATISTGLITATPTAASSTLAPTVAATAPRAATAPPSAAATATPTMLPMPSMPSPAATSSPTAAGSPTAAIIVTGPVIVSIIDFAFDPPLVEVPVGTTVTWRLDVGYHTVVSADFRLNSPILENVGDTYSYTFTEAGTYDYICGIHPNMLGTVKVVR